MADVAPGMAFIGTNARVADRDSEWVHFRLVRAKSPGRDMPPKRVARHDGTEKLFWPAIRPGLSHVCVAFGLSCHYIPLDCRGALGLSPKLTLKEFFMFVTPAYAQSAMGGGGEILMSILPFLLIFVIMYFLIIRPQRTQMKKREEMLKNVRRGDQIITGGGIVGKVTKGDR